MDRRRLAFVLMWVAAVAAMASIYVTREAPADVRERRADAAIVRSVDDDRAPLASDGLGPPRAPEPGPPRQFRGDRRRTGRSPYVGPAASTLAWRARTGGHVSAQAVVGDDGTVYVGSHDHNLYAIGSDGTVRWRRDLGGAIYSTPALVNDRLYVGSDANYFFCVDAASGAVRWHLRTDDDADTAVAVAPDGSLVFGAGTDVFSVNPEGEVRWRFRTGRKVFSAPAVDDDGTVYVGSQDDHLYAIAPDGRMRWRFRTGDDVDGTPAIGDDGTIYVGSDDHRVYAIRRDGTLRWSSDVGSDVRAPVGLGPDGTVYASVLGPHARLVALDGATGAVRWEFAIAGSGGPSVSSGPLVDANGDVYFGADDHYVYSLTREGRMRWFFRTEGRVDGEPVLTPDGMLLVGSDDHSLWALGGPAR